MITLDFLERFLEKLPSPDGDMRGKELNLTYKERDTMSNFRSPNYPAMTPIKFQSTFVMNKWKWVYIGEIVMAWER